MQLILLEKSSYKKSWNGDRLRYMYQLELQLELQSHCAHHTVN